MYSDQFRIALMQAENSAIRLFSVKQPIAQPLLRCCRIRGMHEFEEVVFQIIGNLKPCRETKNSLQLLFFIFLELIRLLAQKSSRMLVKPPTLLRKESLLCLSNIFKCSYCLPCNMVAIYHDCSFRKVCFGNILEVPIHIMVATPNIYYRTEN